MILALDRTFDPSQHPRDDTGRFADKTEAAIEAVVNVLSSGDDAISDVGGAIVEHLQSAGVRAVEAEHAVKAWVANKAEDGIARLPSWLQRAVRKAQWAGMFGVKGAFVTWMAGQAAAEQVARANGLSDEEARRLRGVLTAVDFLSFKPLGLVAGVAGVPTGGVLLASFVPPASAAYLAYSTARNPLATLRAAYGAVKAAASRVGLKLSRGDAASVLCDALRTHYFDDWYIALLSAALDTTGDLGTAIMLAYDAHRTNPMQFSRFDRTTGAWVLGRRDDGEGNYAGSAKYKSGGKTSGGGGAGGRWVTIGAKGDEDGERHGGTRVFIRGDGTIEKGPRHMVGQKPNELGKRKEVKPDEPKAPKVEPDEPRQPQADPSKVRTHSAKEHEQRAMAGKDKDEPKDDEPLDFGMMDYKHEPTAAKGTGRDPAEQANIDAAGVKPHADNAKAKGDRVQADLSKDAADFEDIKKQRAELDAREAALRAKAGAIQTPTEKIQAMAVHPSVSQVSDLHAKAMKQDVSKEDIDKATASLANAADYEVHALAKELGIKPGKTKAQTIKAIKSAINMNAEASARIGLSELGLSRSTRFRFDGKRWTLATGPLSLSLGYATPIREVPLGPSGYAVKTAAGTPIHNFWRRMIADRADYQHPKTKQRFPVSAKQIKDWAGKVKQWVSLGREIPAPVDHSWSAKDNLGKVLDAKVEVEGGRTYLSLLHSVVGDDAKAIVERNWGSLWIEPNYCDEFGKNWGSCITHSSVVTNPVVSGLGPFVPAQAA